MKIIAIIVTYNGMRWYDRCFSSLQKSTIPVDVVVVDNASSDNTLEYLSKWYPKLHVISSKENLGFAKANNIAINFALNQQADYVFLLNQDAWVEENTIELLLHTFLDNDNVGIASPMHLNGSYTGLDNYFCTCVGNACISDMYMNRIKRYYSVPMVNAAAWLISNECLQKVGGFDTLLFKHYGEDDNYAQRVLYHGLKIVINTRCTICHDREYRRDEPIDSPFNVGNTYYYYINQKSNVLTDYDEYKLIRSKRIDLIKAYIYFQPKKIKRLKMEIELDKRILYSRSVNKTLYGGLKWLEMI